jgi:hypothetical protein
LLSVDNNSNRAPPTKQEPRIRSEVLLALDSVCAHRKMKMELSLFSGKKKKRKDQIELDHLASTGKAGSDNGDNLSDPDVMDKIVAGVAGNLAKSTKPSPNDSAVDIIVDSDGEDEIFDDGEDDDGDDEGVDDKSTGKPPNAASSGVGWSMPKVKAIQATAAPLSAGVDYREMLAAGASAIVAPMQKVMKPAEEDDSQRTGDSYHSSEGESEDEEEDEEENEEEEAEETESDDEEEEDDGKRNGKGAGDAGSDSGEDYTDDEDEGEDGYRPGGYHPVKIGEVYNQR